MILNTEQIRQKAHELALTHDPYGRRRPARRLWRDFYGDVKKLRAVTNLFRDGCVSCSQPAEEWLLDHAEFIEEQVLIIRQQLAEAALRNLPHLRKTSEIRVLSFCIDYLDLTDGNLDEESLVSYIKSYQEVAVLTTAEAWLVPLFLRIALLRRLAAVMESVGERREICMSVENLLERLEAPELSSEAMQAVLDEAGQNIPLSGPWIVHLVKHLREKAEDLATVREWLMCKLENGPDSLDRIVSYEYQLQAAYQVSSGNIIGSLRKISRWDWRSSFEQISLVECNLRRENSGVYSLLDSASRDVLHQRVEKIARRMRLPENLVAKQAVELASQEFTNSRPEEAVNGVFNQVDLGKMPRKAFVAYYLLEADGLKSLYQALKKTCSAPRYQPQTSILRRATGVYFAGLTFLFAFFLWGWAAWIKGNAALTLGQWMLLLIALALPVSEWVITVAHWLIECVRRPQRLLKYDFSGGIPPEASTMVVIPVIWSTVKEVQELAERLELHYLANRDAHIHFALLGDFADADGAELPMDAEIMEAARSSIGYLNRTYGRPGGSTFHLFQRRRLWNQSEAVWMGWERKRGKLVEFVELLKGRTDTTYDCVAGDSSVLNQIRYVITLDADTQLPAGSAQRMIGAMHLPYNRPRLNSQGTRVLEGYGVLQPRIAISLKAALRSRFARLWSSHPGIDPYTFAASDPYQDGLGQGIFTGKGIFDVDTFAKVLCERIPENRVLSHDLLEGGFLRAGLLSDVELIDEHPSTFSAYQKRLHRWVRGDWQLLIWLSRRVRDRRGAYLPVDLSPLTRWQIIDNLRRSLLPAALFAVLLLGLNVLPGSATRWFVFVLATWLLPLFRQLAAIRWLFWHPQSLLATAGQVLVTIITLPFQVVMLLDAITRTLCRLFVSKRHLLAWISAAEVERRDKSGGHHALPGIYGGYLLALLLALAAWSSAIPVLQWTGLLLCLLWLSAPLAIRWLDHPAPIPIRSFTSEEEADLRQLAERVWLFFENYVNEEEHWLPPDNVQIDPPAGVARRTSPTNIGLYLAGVLAARDFGFIDTPGLVERLERTVGTIELMEKWQGHLYNWYDTATLAPLPPRYVSTVDSGNFAGCLITVKEGLAEWLETDAEVADEEGVGVKGRSLLKKKELSVAFAEELAPDLNEVNTAAYQDNSRPISSESSRTDYRARGRHVLACINKMISETNFHELYDHKSKLFKIGYNTGIQEPDPVLYDLLASEARLASFIAIALGQVSVSHWHALGRAMTRTGRRTTLLSWSGTMFEYLMPWIFLRTYGNTVWDNTYHAVVHRQIEYAHRRGVPFGISESGYYAFDYRMNYQYRAFGVPGLGFKRGLEQDLVVAPYATILALPFAGQQGLADLAKMKELGAWGEYGYYEAIDFTGERLPKGRSSMVIRSFMAHHQGMSLLTLANLLTPGKIYERFHRDKQVRSTELLLQERIPTRPKIIKHPAFVHARVPDSRPAVLGVLREYLGADTPVPEVCILSNGRFMTMVNNSGSGFCRFEGQAVSRWREDPVLDNWGSYFYIRDVNNDMIWSPTYQPCRVPSSEQRVQFTLDRANFTRVDGDMRTNLEICVSPEWDAEIRRLTLTNAGDEERIMEVTTFCELSLASPMADDAHPAFSKLFIKTEYADDAQCLLAGRRPRQMDENRLWAAHTLIACCQTAIGPVEYETDRAGFIGRGHTLACPQGLRSCLSGRVGFVIDPAFVMRRRFSVKPGAKVQLFAVTAAAATKNELLNIISRFSGELEVERTFQMAWNRSQIELHHLHMTAPRATTFQVLAGRLLYNPPLQRERQQSIADNGQGQSGLWAYGISGDVPVVLALIENSADIPFIVNLLTGHEYLRRLGLPFDLVILNDSMSGYRHDLHDALQRAIEQATHRQGRVSDRVFIINGGQLPEADRRLLYAVARVMLRANGPSIRAQIKPPKRDKSLLPAFLKSAAIVIPNKQCFHPAPPDAGQNLLFYNGWGGFARDGREYCIILKKEHNLPATWINVIANPHFGCLVSELGAGYTWWRNSREYKLTPWSNDPVLDQPGEACYLRDEDTGALWFAGRSAGPSEQDGLVTHGYGFSRWQQEENGIKEETTVFVPLNEPVKVVRVRLRNEGSEPRRLSITYYAEWVLGVQRQSQAPFINTEWEPSARLLLAGNTYQETSFRGATAFLGVYRQPEPFTGPSDRIDAYVQTDSAEQPVAAADNLSCTADREEFIGRSGTWETPAALYRERLSGQTGPIYDSCGAVQSKLTLEPDAERTVYILLGCANRREEAIQLAQKYSQSYACEQALAQIQEFWDNTLTQMIVSTPCAEMDILLNGWLIYQTLGCRMWARTAFYQAGGAYGFRDQLQDSLALLHTRPDLTRAQILIHAARQYEEGDVQHWWHEETQRGVRTHFSDDLLWLPYVAGRYAEHTGDYSIFAETTSFLHSAPLHENEHDRYEQAEISTHRASIFDHCLLAIDRVLERFGEHGLPLIGSGDWNDSLNNIGVAGRGESVWLGWFLCVVLDMFTDLCRQRDELELVKRYKEVRAALTLALDEHGWDGQWYRRAYTDGGRWLGSIYNEECRIDAIAQSWSVVSGAAPRDKQKQAMDSFDRELVDRDRDLVRLLTPPFHNTDPSPGYIQSYLPGVRENGGQYNHGLIWSIIAWCKLGRGDKAFELFQMLNPMTHTRTPNEARQYAGEPYVMAADVYPEDPHRRRAGWTWYTGAAGWMYQAGVEWILGLRRRGERLYVCPCIPEEWPGFSVNYRFGGARYLITVKNTVRANGAAPVLTVDGQEVTANDDCENKNEQNAAYEPFFILHDDGQTHYINLLW